MPKKPTKDKEFLENLVKEMLLQEKPEKEIDLDAGVPDPVTGRTPEEQAEVDTATSYGVRKSWSKEKKERARRAMLKRRKAKRLTDFEGGARGYATMAIQRNVHAKSRVFHRFKDRNIILSPGEIDSIMMKGGEELEYAIKSIPEAIVTTAVESAITTMKWGLNTYNAVSTKFVYDNNMILQGINNIKSPSEWHDPSLSVKRFFALHPFQDLNKVCSTKDMSACVNEMGYHTADEYESPDSYVLHKAFSSINHKAIKNTFERYIRYPGPDGARAEGVTRYYTAKPYIKAFEVYKNLLNSYYSGNEKRNLSSFVTGNIIEDHILLPLESVEMITNLAARSKIDDPRIFLMFCHKAITMDLFPTDHRGWKHTDSLGYRRRQTSRDVGDLARGENIFKQQWAKYLAKYHPAQRFERSLDKGKLQAADEEITTLFDEAPESPESIARSQRQYDNAKKELDIAIASAEELGHAENPRFLKSGVASGISYLNFIEKATFLLVRQNRGARVPFDLSTMNTVGMESATLLQFRVASKSSEVKAFKIPLEWGAGGEIKISSDSYKALKNVHSWYNHVERMRHFLQTAKGKYNPVNIKKHWTSIDKGVDYSFSPKTVFADYKKQMSEIFRTDEENKDQISVIRKPSLYKLYYLAFILGVKTGFTTNFTEIEDLYKCLWLNKDTKKVIGDRGLIPALLPILIAGKIEYDMVAGGFKKMTNVVRSMHATYAASAGRHAAGSAGSLRQRLRMSQSEKDSKPAQKAYEKRKRKVDKKKEKAFKKRAKRLRRTTGTRVVASHAKELAKKPSPVQLLLTVGIVAAQIGFYLTDPLNKWDRDKIRKRFGELDALIRGIASSKRLGRDPGADTVTWSFNAEEMNEVNKKIKSIFTEMETEINAHHKWNVSFQNFSNLGDNNCSIFQNRLRNYNRLKTVFFQFKLASLNLLNEYKPISMGQELPSSMVINSLNWRNFIEQLDLAEEHLINVHKSVASLEGTTAPGFQTGKLGQRIKVQKKQGEKEADAKHIRDIKPIQPLDSVIDWLGKEGLSHKGNNSELLNYTSQKDEKLLSEDSIRALLKKVDAKGNPTVPGPAIFNQIINNVMFPGYPMLVGKAAQRRVERDAAADWAAKGLAEKIASSGIFQAEAGQFRGNKNRFSRRAGAQKKLKFQDLDRAQRYLITLIQIRGQGGLGVPTAIPGNLTGFKQKVDKFDQYITEIIKRDDLSIEDLKKAWKNKIGEIIPDTHDETLYNYEGRSLLYHSGDLKPMGTFFGLENTAPLNILVTIGTGKSSLRTASKFCGQSYFDLQFSYSPDWSNAQGNIAAQQSAEALEFWNQIVPTTRDPKRSYQFHETQKFYNQGYRPVYTRSKLGSLQDICFPSGGQQDHSQNYKNLLGFDVDIGSKENQKSSFGRSLFAMNAIHNAAGVDIGVMENIINLYITNYDLSYDSWENARQRGDRSIGAYSGITKESLKKLRIFLEELKILCGILKKVHLIFEKVREQAEILCKPLGIDPSSYRDGHSSGARFNLGSSLSTGFFGQKTKKIPTFAEYLLDKHKYKPDCWERWISHRGKNAGTCDEQYIALLRKKAGADCIEPAISLNKFVDPKQKKICSFDSEELNSENWLSAEGFNALVEQYQKDYSGNAEVIQENAFKYIKAFDKLLKLDNAIARFGISAGFAAFDQIFSGAERARAWEKEKTK